MSLLRSAPLGKITNRNVPLLVMLALAILVAVGLLEGVYLTMYTFGLLLSWTYLRFYQHHANGSKGDMAESFAFHTFFPNVLQPAIAIVGNTVFSILVKLRLCNKTVHRYQFGGSGGAGSNTAISISLPGMENQDSERRRQIALKALSERLTKVESSGGAAGKDDESAWPNLEGGDGGSEAAKAVSAGAAAVGGSPAVHGSAAAAAASSASAPEAAGAKAEQTTGQ